MYDLEQFKGTYIAECFDLLGEMEETLLSLDPEHEDLEEINAIFRCAHSIKGGGGAFGFARLVAFTHILEMLLDAMREGAMKATKDVTDALLQSVDVVSQLVEAAQEGVEAEEGFEDELANKLKVMAASGGAEIIVEAKEEVVKVEQTGGKEISFFDIKFIPKKTLIASGNEPLLVIRELSRLGELIVHCDSSAVPPLEEIDYEDCFLTWNFELSTDKGLDAINEVFEFIDDECDIDIDEMGAICMPCPAPEESGLFEDDDGCGLYLDQLEKDKTGASEVKNSVKTPAAKASAAKSPAAKSKAPAVSTIRVDIAKVDNMVNMVGELVITQAMITEQTKDLLPEDFHQLLQGVEELTRHTRELQEAVMSVRMQPVKSVFARMPRLVRDLSRKLDKKIRLEMIGEATEIDKTVIEQLSDPLTHMIRNSVDHGIESPEVRKANGKPEEGVIFLSADNSGGKIIIEISDNGGGISRERVLAKAKEKNLIADGVELTNEEVDNLIFKAGFSTAEAVTDVSGRGVGMDVVRRNIEDLGGEVELQNTPGEGSKFVVSLPLTLAILDGMIVGVGEENYIIPINSIIESLSPDRENIKQVADGNNVLNVRGEFVPIVNLGGVFNVKPVDRKNDRMLVIIIESGRDKFGLIVDEIIGQQQVVIKSIEENTDPVDGISGATILGDGNVALILDVAKIKCMSSQGESTPNLKVVA